MNQIIHPLSIILHRLLGKSVRMEGLVALMIENCKACSAFPDYINPLKTELDSVVTVINELIDVFDKEVKK